MDELGKQAWVTRVLGYEFPSDLGGRGGFGAALARWRQAMADVRADLARFRTTLLADKDIKTDPRLRFVAAAASEIPNMLPAGGSRLEAAILSAARASGDPASVRAAVADYRDALASATRLAKLEDFARSDIKAPLAVRATLAQAMDDIERTLARAA